MATTLQTLTAIEARLTGIELKVAQILKAVAPVVPALVLPPADKPLWSADFTKMPWESGLHQQEFAPGRITLVNVGGRNAVRLHTEPGDNLYAGADVERTQLHLPQELTEGYEGREQHWAHGVWFPDDFVAPPGIWGVAFDFHHSSNSGGQANFHLDFSRYDGEVLRFRGYAEGNTTGDTPTYEKVIGPIKRNTWHDFFYHVLWTSKANGFMQAWVKVGNEPIARKVLDYKGPTLYANDGVYMNATNYHQAHGRASAIIHGPIAMGRTWQSVTSTPLEGV